MRESLEAIAQPRRAVVRDEDHEDARDADGVVRRGTFYLCGGHGKEALARGDEASTGVLPGGASLERGRGARSRPPSDRRRTDGYRFLAEVRRFAVDLRALLLREAGLRADVRFFAVDFRAVDLRPVLLRAVDFRPVDLRAVDFRPVDFRAVDFLVVDFFAVDFLAVDFLAVDFRAVDFLAGDLRAVDLRAVDFFAVDFRAVDFFLAGDIGHPLPHRQDAIRFRRRRSRSLMPPHTPYRSSRRRA